MKIENVDGTVTVQPSEDLGHFTQWQERALQANGFKRNPAGAFVSKRALAQHCAEIIKNGGIG